MRRGGGPRRGAALLAVLVAAGISCARRPPQITGAAVPGVLAMREQALPGLRLAMRVRVAGVESAAALDSPAYLAVDGTEQVRLQVLSPFGATVLDLRIDGDAYRIDLPLQGRTVSGAVDLGALSRGDTAPDERMIVALALLFRPKIDPAACDTAASPLVTCRLGHGLALTVAVDAHLRPLSERYADADGTTLLRVTYDDYDGPSPSATPGRIEIRGAEDDEASLTVRVVRAHREAT